MLRLTLAGLHLIALGIGLGAVFNRGAFLREPLTPDALRRIFRADAVWGIAAALWLVTGVWRLAAGTEKPAQYYLSNYLFHLKITLFLLVVALEIWPMVTLIRWRRAAAKGDSLNVPAHAAAARRMAIISHIEGVLVVVIVFVAIALARGYGLR
jgi:putative membrane protein